MTELDELALSAAKLLERSHGNLDGPVDFHKHAGLVEDDQDRQVLSVLEAADVQLPDELETAVRDTVMTREATRAVDQKNGARLANMTGITEQELSADQLTLVAQLNDRLENNGAPAFWTFAGRPETGKTNTGVLAVDVRDQFVDDLLVVSNVRTWDRVDRVVTSMFDLTTTLLEERHRPKMVFLDEGSTHFDARTYRREVATQYTPVAKRYAKLGVDAETVVCHTGKDLHPERKRLTTTAVWKLEKKEAEVYADWPEDSSTPEDREFGGPLLDLERAEGYDPDDAAPWSWDLPAEVFTEDLDWPGYLKELRNRGPAES